MVVDAPCSGSGTWRRTPGEKWRFSPDRLDALLALQGEILNEAQAHVRSGGRLAYMTCSLIDLENEAQVDGFLAGNSGWTLEKSERWFPGDGGDGFFLAIMRKEP